MFGQAKRKRKQELECVNALHHLDRIMQFQGNEVFKTKMDTHKKIYAKCYIQALYGNPLYVHLLENIKRIRSENPYLNEFRVHMAKMASTIDNNVIEKYFGMVESAKPKEQPQTAPPDMDTIQSEFEISTTSDDLLRQHVLKFKRYYFLGLVGVQPYRLKLKTMLNNLVGHKSTGYSFLNALRRMFKNEQNVDTVANSIGRELDAIFSDGKKTAVYFAYLHWVILKKNQTELTKCEMGWEMHTRYVCLVVDYLDDAETFDVVRNHVHLYKQCYYTFVTTEKSKMVLKESTNKILTFFRNTLFKIKYKDDKTVEKLLSYKGGELVDLNHETLPYFIFHATIDESNKWKISETNVKKYIQQPVRRNCYFMNKDKDLKSADCNHIAEYETDHVIYHSEFALVRRIYQDTMLMFISDASPDGMETLLSEYGIRITKFDRGNKTYTVDVEANYENIFDKVERWLSSAARSPFEGMTKENTPDRYRSLLFYDKNEVYKRVMYKHNLGKIEFDVFTDMLKKRKELDQNMILQISDYGEVKKRFLDENKKYTEWDPISTLAMLIFRQMYGLQDEMKILINSHGVIQEKKTQSVKIVPEKTTVKMGYAGFSMNINNGFFECDTIVNKYRSSDKAKDVRIRTMTTHSSGETFIDTKLTTSQLILCLNNLAAQWWAMPFFRNLLIRNNQFSNFTTGEMLYRARAMLGGKLNVIFVACMPFVALKNAESQKRHFVIFMINYDLEIRNVIFESKFLQAITDNSDSAKKKQTKVYIDKPLIDELMVKINANIIPPYAVTKSESDLLLGTCVESANDTVGTSGTIYELYYTIKNLVFFHYVHKYVFKTSMFQSKNTQQPFCANINESVKKYKHAGKGLTDTVNSILVSKYKKPTLLSKSSPFSLFEVYIEIINRVAPDILKEWFHNADTLTAESSVASNRLPYNNKKSWNNILSNQKVKQKGGGSSFDNLAFVLVVVVTTAVLGQITASS